jgi:glycerol-3-phosphate acyltransferase PlsY
MPGLAAIGLYLAALAGVIILGVVEHHYPLLFLFFPMVFFAASAGLMLLLRWAWALTLSAVLLLAVYNTWVFSSQHFAPSLVQGLLNWVFFFYLIRIEVRSKLR